MKTVLVVEDFSNTRKMLKLMLNLEKRCRVIEAADGLMAIALAKQEQPDLILLGMNLPKMDGFEAARQIRDQAETSHIPIVAMSAYQRRFDWQEQALRARCVECLEKPFDFLVWDRLIMRYLPFPAQVVRKH